MKVVLVVADSLRADAPGYAGGAGDTPFLDSLADEGAWFEEAFASGAWTIPSILSMLTSALPHTLGITRWRHPFPADRPTLFASFANAGYEVRCFHPYPRWGFLNTPGAGRVGDSQEPEAVIDALRRASRDSFFLIHHWWTHLPYLNRHLPLPQWHAACDFTIESLGRHPERIAATAEKSYLEAVRHLSESLLSRYLEAASAGGGDVLLVVTGDHGETWGKALPAGRRVENIYDLHGRWIADETIRIPLLFFGRGARGAIPARGAVPGFARGVDIGATIADLSGVPWQSHESDVGTSLVPALEGGGPAHTSEIVTMTSQNAHVPRVYPETGKETWRTFAKRTRKSWFVWDAVDGTRQVTAVGGGVDESFPEVVFRDLEEMWSAARDPGPLISDESAKTEERLISLGYLE